MTPPASEKKLSLQGLRSALLRRNKKARHFVEIEIIEVGKLTTSAEIEGVLILIQNDKIIHVEA